MIYNYITLHEDGLPVGGRCSHLYKDLAKKSYLTFQNMTNSYAKTSQSKWNGIQNHPTAFNNIEHEFKLKISGNFRNFWIRVEAGPGTLGKSNSTLFI